MTDTAAQSIALALGVSSLVTVVCRRLRIPSLLPLLGVGLALGTSGIGLVDASSVGPALTGFITVAIGLLIFEGALHLNREELNRAPRAVWGLLSTGALVTWIGAAIGAHFLLGMSLPTATLLGAALIVTGPTVVQPILRVLHVTPRLHATLSAEAVLIDPIGVVATVATLEIVRRFLVSGPEFHLAEQGLVLIAKPLLGGAGLGVIAGFVGHALLVRMGRGAQPDPQLLTLMAVGICMTCVGVGEAITPEAGLAAVSIAGVIMARAQVLGATELRSFKELLAILLVGTLFVLLASRFDISRLATLTWYDGAFILALLFVVRPIGVLLSTWRSQLSMRERWFAATFAPRGIVALSVATVASSELALLVSDPASGVSADAQPALLADIGRIEVAMFAVIAGTVLLATVFSPLAAWALRVRATTGTAVLIVGAHPLGVAMWRWLNEQGISARLIDSNEDRVASAAGRGIDALLGDATDRRWMDDVAALPDTGWVIAWTGNHDVDQIAVRWAQDRFGAPPAAMWSSRPARGAAERADLGAGDSIGQWLSRFETNRAALRAADRPEELHRVLGWLVQGQFSMNLPNTTLPAPGEGVRFVGITIAVSPERSHE